MSGFVDRQRFRRDHRWAPRRMSELLDGDLPPAGLARMERHLVECGECRRLLAGLRQIVGGLHGLSAVSGVDALQIAASVRARLSEPD